PQMTFIIKALTTLDGIARALDPQYNLLAAAQPFVRSLAVSKEEGQSRIGSLAKQTKEFVLYQFQKPTRTEMAIKRLESRIELGEIQFRVKSLEGDRQLRSIFLAVKTIMYGTFCGFATIVGVLLLPTPNYAIAMFCLAMFFLFLTGRSLIKLLLQERIDRLIRK
ncbi:MAG: AarF/ABC1/UbiB kinase family protein, partial [Limnothrix sp. RL_2_0]|nr:AarF/ABC1/UbiB kinase family protein [Limnothrix sp. RL_2_0]